MSNRQRMETPYLKKAVMCDELCNMISTMHGAGVKDFKNPPDSAKKS